MQFAINQHIAASKEESGCPGMKPFSKTWKQTKTCILQRFKRAKGGFRLINAGWMDDPLQHPIYSTLKLLTGFAPAFRKAWNPTVRTAMSNAIVPVVIKKLGCIDMR
jgi:hypothetical protein